jgi:hypothetical protein
MATELFAWWTALRVATLINAALWLRAARMLRRRSDWPAALFAERRMQLWLAAVYVVICGFRSFLPRADVQRICLVDSMWSSVFVGRTVATISELCFAYQWARYVRELAEGVGSRGARAIARVLFPMIIWAEISSWYAVLTRNFLGNAIEQSTWTTCGVLISTAFYLIWQRAHAELRTFIERTAAVIACFVVFMCTVDVPLYLSRWRSDQLAGRTYLSWQDGLRDAAQRWVVTHDWGPWRDEAAWMALYFSVGVWTSIALALAPGAQPGAMRAAMK